MHASPHGEILLVLALVASVPPRRMEVEPSEWPLERFVTNLEQELQAHPDDAEAHYYLGRALGFAFALERSSLSAVQAPRRAADLAKQRAHGPGNEARPTPAQSLDRLTKGVLHLRKACELDEGAAAFGLEQHGIHAWWTARKHLTLAWLLETGAHLADRVPTLDIFAWKPPQMTEIERQGIERTIAAITSSDALVADEARKSLASSSQLERALGQLVARTATPDPKLQEAVAALLERYWLERAIAEYWIAYEENVARDLSPEAPHAELEATVSYEALLGYERLVQKRGVKNANERRRLDELAQKKKQLEARSRERAFITPVLLSVTGCRSLAELVTPELAVPFDLDGDGVDELWPWIAPDAGWLVWDPARRGEITSGRQLFGSASAWLFFRDGYRVLDALDDDRDGALRGTELAGIAVWFDRDTDGVSDRGEVVPVEELGIAALRTDATILADDSPANPCGLELADGRVLPTYDWVLAPVATP